MLKEKSFSFCLFLFLSLVLLQPADAGWIKTYGEHASDYGFWVEQTPDAGYIMIGQDNIAKGAQNLIVVKTDSAGDTLWTRLYREYPTSMFAWGRCIQTTSDGGYAAAGSGGGWPWLLRLNASGDTIWTRLYTLPHGMFDLYCLRKTTNGYIMVGFATSGLTHLIIAVDSLGDTLWTRSYGIPDSFSLKIGFSVQPTPDGGFIATGSGPDYGLWILKMDSGGDTLWTKLYKLGDPYSYDEGHSIEPTSDGNWIIAGAADYEVATHGALLLMKIKPNGDTLWTRTYDFGPREEYGKSVKQTPDGGYIVVGEKNYSMQGSGSVWLLKTDSTGDTVWTRTFGKGGYYQDRGDCVQLTSDGGYIITGFSESYSFNNSKKALLIKVDSLGLLGIEEDSLSYASASWELSSHLGKVITLRYSDFPNGFRAQVFDASGRRIDEIQSPQTHGTIQWGGGEMPGVYFIVAESSKVNPRKVIIVK